MGIISPRAKWLSEASYESYVQSTDLHVVHKQVYSLTTVVKFHGEGSEFRKKSKKVLWGAKMESKLRNCPRWTLTTAVTEQTRTAPPVAKTWK